MQQAVKAHHTKLTSALRERVEAKLFAPLLRHLDDPAAKLEVHLDDSVHAERGLTERCRAHLTMPGAKDIVVTAHASDMYAAIDLLHDRLMQQARRGRERLRAGRAERRLAARQKRADAPRPGRQMRPIEIWQLEAARFAASEGRSA